ncbi:MAG: hypothetical protein ABUK08_00130 [Candidatus Humimicrobiaceae bacterium]
MDNEKILIEMRELLEGNEDNTGPSKELISSMAVLVAENIMLSLQDDTARSLVLSMVTASGGSFKIKERIDYKSSEYRVIVVPLEDDVIELKVVKKDIETDVNVH